MKHCIALAAGLLLAGAAQAQTGLYTSIGGGLSSYNLDCAGTTQCDNSGSALRAAFGWRSQSNFGVEAVYINFGKASASLNVPGSGLVSVEVKTSMLGAGAVMFLPLGSNFDLALRLGVANVEAKTGGSISNVSVDLGTDKTTNVYAGIGGSYAITSNLRVELNWDSTRFEAVGDEANVGALTAGLRFTF
jgi:hypothetical protein